VAKEKILQTKILNDLRSFGKYCECFKIEKSSDNGTSDIFFSIVKCGPTFLEVKAPGEKPSSLQEQKIEKLRKCGCRATWIDSWDKWIELKTKLGIIHLEEVKKVHDELLFSTLI